MFKSATVKLTAWYLSLLMLLSIVFSGAIYLIATSEMKSRLDHFQITMQASQSSYPQPPHMMSNVRDTVGYDNIRSDEKETASTNMLAGLVYINICVLVAGGFISYLLARRHLLPIERIHEAQSRFTSDASHELRTPLAVMRTELEVAIKDKNATLDELRDVLRSSLEEVKGLSRLSEMLLDLSRLDVAGLEMRPIRLDIIANDIVNSFKKQTQRITISVPRHGLIVKGNDVALSDAIKVLIDNALQYSPDKSQIKIRLKKLNDNAELEIINSGSGINSENLLHIFERFYRADSSRTSGPTKGYGLGLALAKKIVDLHNGSISAESAPGKNTRFTISLPLYKHFKAKNKK